MSAKTNKPEQYGPRKMPLLRTANLSDKEWDAATLAFDDTMRRLGKKITWPTRFKRCPKCGASNLANRTLEFGSMSGWCMPCSDAAVEEMLR